MKATFIIREKKFGPADNASKRQKQAARVEECFTLSERDLGNEEDDGDEEFTSRD